MKPYCLFVFACAILAGSFLMTPPLAAQEEISAQGHWLETTGKSPAQARKQEVAPGVLHQFPDAPVVNLGVAPGRPVQAYRSRLTGVVRAVDTTSLDAGQWLNASDGRAIWRLAIESAAASRLRVHFEEFAVGDGKVYVYSSPEAVQAFTGHGVYEDGDFWTGFVSGSRAVIEYAPADGLATRVLPFRISGVTHGWADTVATAGRALEGRLHLNGYTEPEPMPATVGLAAAEPGRTVASCHLDSTCYAEWRAEASAIALIHFVTGPFSSSCTGALISSRSGAGRPLFLTADHCISNEAEARSVTAQFYYQTSTCNAPGPDSNLLETVLGASYVASAPFAKGDYSLIELRGLPARAFFLGWTTTVPTIGAKLTGIHHPLGSHKRITFGVRDTDDGFYVLGDKNLEYGPSDLYLAYRNTDGRVQPGSSGSPLINEAKQVVGTLSVGPALSEDGDEADALTCSTNPYVVLYGRFAAAFPNFRTFLDDFRPGQIAAPRAGASLPPGSVLFSWSTGVGAAEYRLSVGRTLGGSDIFDRTMGKSLSQEVAVPSNVQTLYARLWTRIDGRWETHDAAYLANAKPNSRPGEIVTPRPGTILDTNSAVISWANGIGVQEYKLDVGSIPGGNDIFGRNMGLQTSVTVSNLPTDGRFLYVRLWSRIGVDWLPTYAVFKAQRVEAE